MQRSPLPPRTVGLKPGKPPKRTTRIAQRSEKTILDLPRRAEEWAAVLERDGHTCRLAGAPPPWGTCIGPPTPHHLRKASQGGQYVRENLVVLCAGHNGEVERRRPLARRLGLELTRTDSPCLPPVPLLH